MRFALCRLCACVGTRVFALPAVLRGRRSTFFLDHGQLEVILLDLLRALSDETVAEELIHVWTHLGVPLQAAVDEVSELGGSLILGYLGRVSGVGY